MGIKYFYLFFLILFSFVFFSSFSFAQLGEQAGQSSFNISTGSNQSINFLIINSGQSPITYKIILPIFNKIPHNTTPTLIVTPMNGILSPNSQQRININAYMPSNNKPNLKWTGILQIVDISPHKANSSGMGVVIQSGVAKIVTIESAPPKPLPLIDYIIIVLIIIAIIAILCYSLIKRKAKSVKKQIIPKVDIIKAKQPIKKKITTKQKKTIKKKITKPETKKKTIAKKKTLKSESNKKTSTKKSHKINKITKKTSATTKQKKTTSTKKTKKKT